MADWSFEAFIACMGYAEVAVPAQNYVGKLDGIACNSVGTKRKQSNCNSVGTKREQSNFHKRTAKAACVDKQTFTYARATAKEVVSTGCTFKERSTGRVGIKNEYTTTKTCRVGDKSGYSEYQVEERYRRVNYGGNSSSKGNSGNNGNSSIKGSSRSNRKTSIKGISSSTKGFKASSNTKASASIKTTSSTKGSSNTKVSASIKTTCGARGSSGTKANASIKTSYSTKGSHY